MTIIERLLYRDGLDFLAEGQGLESTAKAVNDDFCEDSGLTEVQFHEFFRERVRFGAATVPLTEYLNLGPYTKGRHCTSEHGGFFAQVQVLTSSIYHNSKSDWLKPEFRITLPMPGKVAT
jgi:hypothetical protein